MKKWTFRGLSIVSYALPALAAGVGWFMFKNNLTNEAAFDMVAFLTEGGFGKALIGTLLMLIGSLYALFGASEESRMPTLMIVWGTAFMFVGNFIQVIGVVLIAIPLSFMAGRKLWQMGGK